MEKTGYVVGFLFAPGLAAGDRVLLIRKRRPKWQVGRLNGIGGHIEPGETPAIAMHREFQEEAGVAGLSWQCVAVLTGDRFQVHFFAAWTDAETFDSATAQTDEPLERHPVSELWRLPVIPNLRVLIPLALDHTGIVKPVILTDDVPAAALSLHRPPIFEAP